MAGSKRLVVLTRRRAGPSFRQRIEPYLPALAGRGVACEVVELARSPWVRARQLQRAGGYDGVLVQKKTLTAWDVLFLRRARAVIIYDFDDAVLYKARRAEGGPDPGRLRRFARTVRAASLVIAGNNILAGHATAAGAAWVEVVPTGLATARYGPAPRPRTDGRCRLVWIGSRSTLKQLRPFYRTLQAIGQALPGVVLRIIADAPLVAEGLEVENVPWSRQGETELLAGADVGIAPLPDTPFTRGKCGFKVLQYMATGLPVVASPVGVNAEYVVHEQTGLLARTTEEWVSAIGRLSADAGLRRRMGQAGRGRAEGFDFAVLAPRFCRIVLGALGA